MLPPELPEDTPFPELRWETSLPPTQPLALHERPVQTRLDLCMATIGRPHPDVAKAIVDFWGHADCVEYLQTLVMRGAVVADQRQPFRPEVLTALLDIIAFHQRQYPSGGPDRAPNRAFRRSP